MNNKTYPTPLAFLIADSVIDDIGTRKKSIIGIFNSICSSRFPFRHGELSLFVSLTEGYGEYDSYLVCSRASDEKEILKTHGKLKFSTPNSVVEMSFVLRNIEFPTPGKYTFQFFCEEHLLILRPFEVVSMEKNP
jgi:hypothetical protein